MIIITSESDSGKELITVGTVEGRIIQKMNSTPDSAASRNSLKGDALKKHREMMSRARDTAERQMKEEAEKMGADAIVCVRYSSAPAAQDAIEVMAYGTAVKFRKRNESE